MNIDQTKAIHGMAMACDPRVQPMDTMGFAERIWARILADVPFEAAADVIAELYSTERRIVLQPGHIVDAWKDLEQRLERTRRGIASAQRYIDCFADTDPPEVIATKRAALERMRAELPPYARTTPTAPALAGTGPAPTHWAPKAP